MARQTKIPRNYEAKKVGPSGQYLGEFATKDTGPITATSESLMAIKPLLVREMAFLDTPMGRHQGRGKEVRRVPQLSETDSICECETEKVTAAILSHTRCVLHDVGDIAGIIF